MKFAFNECKFFLALSHPYKIILLTYLTDSNSLNINKHFKAKFYNVGLGTHNLLTSQVTGLASPWSEV